jgi:hypothetical protein
VSPVSVDREEYAGVSTKLLEGAPKLHGTGIGGTGGNINRSWMSTQPFTPDAGKGWGVRLTGDIHLTATGTYNFRFWNDDGLRMWIDDQIVSDEWTDKVGGYYGAGSFGNTSDSWHRIRIDYYNKAGDTDAELGMLMTPPGGAETVNTGSVLSPQYGLTTSQTAYDSSSAVGDVTSTTNYGANPELGLAQSSNLDQPGLNYT